MTEYQKKGDVVFTPDWVAKDIVDYFKPTGIILDPCKGKVLSINLCLPTHHIVK